MDSLTISDRGDCCPAQARVLAGKGDLRLQFCAHHFSKHMKELESQGWEIIIENFEGLKDNVGVKV